MCVVLFEQHKVEAEPNTADTHNQSNYFNEIKDLKLYFPFISSIEIKYYVKEFVSEEIPCIFKS